MVVVALEAIFLLCYTKFRVQLANYGDSVMNGAHHASIVPHQNGLALILIPCASRRVCRLHRRPLHQL